MVVVSQTASIGIEQERSSAHQSLGFLCRPRLVRSPHRHSTSATPEISPKRSRQCPSAVGETWISPIAATRTVPPSRTPSEVSVPRHAQNPSSLSLFRSGIVGSDQVREAPFADIHRGSPREKTIGLGTPGFGEAADPRASEPAPAVRQEPARDPVDVRTVDEAEVQQMDQQHFPVLFMCEQPALQSIRSLWRRIRWAMSAPS